MIDAIELNYVQQTINSGVGGGKCEMKTNYTGTAGHKAGGSFLLQVVAFILQVVAFLLPGVAFLFSC